MGTIGERIRLIRKKNELTLVEFGERIGISNQSLSALENGKNNPSNQTILMICREFDVAEDWLRTGNGEIFVKMSLAEEIADYSAKILTDKDAELQRRIIALMARIPPETWHVLEEKAREVFGQNEEEQE